MQRDDVFVITRGWQLEHTPKGPLRDERHHDTTNRHVPCPCHANGSIACRSLRHHDTIAEPRADADGFELEGKQ